MVFTKMNKRGESGKLGCKFQLRRGASMKPEDVGST
jgi:hypothetical protein